MQTTIDASALSRWLTAHFPAALHLLQSLVEVNSFTANRAGVLENASRIAAAFAPLGFTAERIQATHPEHGDHLFLTQPGDAPASPTVALISHLDAVYTPEEERANDFHWRIEGDRLFGPGVNDIKGGTAMMWLVLSALQHFAPDTFRRTRWVIALNASEEVDSTQFAPLARERIGDHPSAILVFEASHPVDEHTSTLVTRRKGRIAARIESRGRSAHSGVDHAHGANALVDLSAAMTAIARRTDYTRDVTWNPANLTADGLLNRVPDLATGEVEVRAFDPAALREARETLLALEGQGEVRSASDGQACLRKVTILGADPPWPGSAATDALLSHWQRAAETLGRRIAPQARGGLSDANHLYSPHTPLLDGLGPIGLSAHCSKASPDGATPPEWIDLPSFPTLAAIHTLALADLLST